MHDTPQNFDVDAALAALEVKLAPLIAADPDAVMIGIETGGAWIAERLYAQFDLAAPLGTLNITSIATISPPSACIRASARRRSRPISMAAR
jgi:pyrimidine operon attenuation protein/uracil phosphoribosyltransferase